jgi:hypothetical protein
LFARRTSFVAARQPKGIKIFDEQACPKAANLLSEFNKSTRRANHFKNQSSPLDKNILIFRNRKPVYIHLIPSQQEGRCATSSTRDGDAVDADGAPDEGG